MRQHILVIHTIEYTVRFFVHENNDEGFSLTGLISEAVKEEDHSPLIS